MDPVTQRFDKIGGRARILPSPGGSGLQIDVRSDKGGEFFDLRVSPGQTLQALDVRPRDRHLVLLVRGEESARFLCGHDERHWFVAAIPEGVPVSTVAQAKDALKPQAVRLAERGLRRKHRNRRRNPAYVRQGEWFFVPTPEFVPGPRDCVTKNEPIMRNRRGKPHIAAEAVRTGGETRYFLRGGTTRRNAALVDEIEHRFPSGMREHEFRSFMREQDDARGLPLVPMVVDPELYVRGRVRHPDHKTVELNGWHRVYMNTENAAAAMRHVVFMD